MAKRRNDVLSSSTASVSTLPERTALLCPQSDLAESVVVLVHESGLDRTHRLGELALDNNSPDDRPVSGVRFDIAAQV